MEFYTDIERDLEFRKKYGAHFTPETIVIEMCSYIFDMIGPINDLSNFKVLDIASGTGIFSFYFAKQLSDLTGTSFKEALEKHCFMAELDKIFIDKCEYNFGRLGCNTNIYKGDALFNEDMDEVSFDVIIGNPPYVRIQNLDDEYRKKLQNNYLSCRFGASDIYLAFIERSLSLLKFGGSLGLITPASYLRSEAGRALRGMLADNLVYVKDFGSEKQFDCGAYTAITYAKNEMFSSKEFIYELNSITYLVDRSTFVNKLIIGGSNNNRTLKDVCKIRGGIATLRDKIFIFEPDVVNDEYFIYHGFKIEVDATKKFVKLSVTKTEKDIYNSKLVCIYPYKITESGYERYSESEFEDKFPGAYAYLKSNKALLLERDKGKDKGYEWFEFGRTQGFINTSECIVTSTMNKSPNFFTANLSGYLFSAGLALYDISIPLIELMAILNSDSMETYMSNNGSKYSGGWRGYNKKILEKFPIYK